jgi:hypothetical protein
VVTKIKLASRLTPFIYILVFCLFGLSLFVAGTAVPAQATSDMQMIDGLVEKAAENGAVRVIVQLNVPFHPEGELPGMAAAQNQHRIRTNRWDQFECGGGLSIHPLPGPGG